MSQTLIENGTSTDLRGGTQVLVIGDARSAHETVSDLVAVGMSAAVTMDADAVLDQFSTVMPKLVLVDRSVEPRSTTELVRRLRSRAGRRPSVVVVGGEDAQPRPKQGGAPAVEPEGVEYLPGDISSADLAEHIRSRFDPPPVPERPVTVHRSAVSEQRMAEDIERELTRAGVTGRPGVLVVIDVAEMSRLRSRLGASAGAAVASAFDALLAHDAMVLEEHCVTAEGRFLLLLPEAGLAAARERLNKLSRRVSGVALDVAGESVRLTPVIGYTTFAGATSGEGLVSQASTALAEAFRHLDLVPVGYSPQLAADNPPPTRDRILSLVERLIAPLQIGFSVALLLSLPFLVYVAVWYAGFDLTSVTYVLVAVALVGTSAVLWLENVKAFGTVALPPEPGAAHPPATAIVAAYLPNEAATIVDTLHSMLALEYPGELTVILAYNTPQRLPAEDTLVELAARDPRLMLLRVEGSTSKAQNINAALEHVRGEFVGIFDADHHPAPGSFSRAWRWLAQGHDVVQGHCVVRNGESSWVSRLIAVEFETIYAVSHPGRARLHGFGIFGGSNGYWRTDALRQTRMRRSMLTEDIDSSMRGLQNGLSIVSDPGLVSTELAPTTISALWHQRMRWAQGWAQTSRRHLLPAATCRGLTARQRIGAVFLLGWAQLMPWVTIQVVPIVGFAIWRDGGVAGLGLYPLFALLSILTLTVGVAQTWFAYALGDSEIRRHKSWFITYALHSLLWFGEVKNLIARVAQLKELLGERQWRVTPRVSVASTSPEREATATDPVEEDHSLAA